MQRSGVTATDALPQLVELALQLGAALSSSSVSRASSSSIRASAKPTWISTQSPGSTGAAGSSTSATLTSRRTPEMSTLARPRLAVDELDHLAGDA